MSIPTLSNICQQTIGDNVHPYAKHVLMEQRSIDTMNAIEAVELDEQIQSCNVIGRLPTQANEQSILYFAQKDTMSEVEKYRHMMRSMGKPLAKAKCARVKDGKLVIRIDDYNFSEFWLECSIPIEEINEAINNHDSD